MEKIKLNIRGLLRENLIINYAAVLNYDKHKNERILICDYSDFDIPLGFTFTSIKFIRNQKILDTAVKLKSVTQEHGKTFDLIPKGFKTICNFIFINKNYKEIVDNLPLIGDWYDSENVLEFS